MSVCNFCQLEGPVVRKSPPTCKRCYNMQYKRPTATCVKCNKLRQIHTKDGLCDSCYRKTKPRPKAQCSGCGKLRVVKKNTNQGPLCNGCYEQPKKICSACQLERKICDKQKQTCRNCYNKEKRRVDEQFRISTVLRQRLYSALESYGNGKTKKSDDYGINYEAIMDYLCPFPDDTSQYHIDHIFPLCAFDLTNPIEIRAAFAPENHQWLKACENMSKNDKYNASELEKYIEKFKESIYAPKKEV